MKILIINGPNLNMLGIREPMIYGNNSYKELKRFCKKSAKELSIKAKIVQYNEEGKIISAIQKSLNKFNGIIINAGGYTHTSVAILDALKSVNLPTIEVHLSDIQEREEFRKLSYISLYAKKQIIGKGFLGYKQALEQFKKQ